MTVINIKYISNIVYSIICLKEKKTSLFEFVLFVEKKSQEAKTNEKYKREETPKKKHVEWVILYRLLPLRRHRQSHTKLEK